MTRLRLITFLIILFTSVTAFGRKITLDESEQLAINNSFQLQNSRQAASVAYLAHKLGIRDFLPQLSFTYSENRQVKYYNEDADSIQAGVTVTQPVYNGGKSVLQRKLSKVQLNLESASLAKQVEDIKDQVWQQYYQVMVYKKKLDLQEELFGLTQDQLSITKKKYEFGNITEIDFLESEIEVQGLEIEISTTKNSYQQLRAKFNNLLGLDDKTELDLYPEISPDYPGIDLDVSIKDYLYSITINKNLDLETTKFEIMQAKAQYDIATKSFIPTISLEGTVMYSGDQLPLQTPTYSAKINFEFPYKAMPVSTSAGISKKDDLEYSKNQSLTAKPLNDMGFLLDRKSALIQLNQSLEKEEELKKELYFSIKQQLLDLQQKRDALLLNRRALKLQNRKLIVLETKHRLGEVKEIDLLKGRIEYYNQEIAIWEAILELVITERALEKTIGLGLGELKDLRIYK